jgi:hypothetical protein
MHVYAFLNMLEMFVCVYICVCVPTNDARRQGADSGNFLLKKKVYMVFEN